MKVTEAMKATMIEQYKAGDTLKTIGGREGVCDATILKVLKAARVTMRATGARPGRPSKKGMMPDKPVEASRVVLDYNYMVRATTATEAPVFRNAKDFIKFKRMRVELQGA